MITAHGSEKIAVEAMKDGAEDYVPKPFDNDEIRLVVRGRSSARASQREHRLLLEQVQRDFGFENLIGTGPAMQRVFETLQKVAETDLTVLVRGESGTGKELVAQALHDRSPRRQRPFVAVNCAAISRELVESELFGHEKGAFTGADARRAGPLRGGRRRHDPARRDRRHAARDAGQGAARAPGALLRAGRREQADRRRRARDRRHAPQSRGRGAQAALPRGSLLPPQGRAIELPPLRERAEDIPALAQRFLERVTARLGREKRQLGDAALARLVRHRWPGNVRELAQRDRAGGRAGARLRDREADLQLGGAGEAATGAPADLAGLSFGDAKKRAVDRFERGYLLEALRKSGGNISRAAEAIGMVRQSLQQKIRELGLRDEDWTGVDRDEENP